MKTRLFLMAMAGVALASCVSEDVSDVKQKEEKVKIAFESPVLYGNAESRAVAGEIVAGNKSYPEGENFRVFGVQHETAFIGWTANNVRPLWGTESVITVKYNQDLNGWSPWNGINFVDYFWNIGMKASFAAYSPADAVGTFSYGADGLTITDFKVDDTPKNQYDLMFSSRNVDVEHSNHTFNGYAGTPIRFHHALASIRFAIVGDDEAKLNGIKVNNVVNQGDFKENYNESHEKSIAKEYVFGENVNPEWTVDESEKDFTIYEGIEVNFTESPQFVLALLKKADASYDDAKNFLMIPQSFTNAESTFNKDVDPHLEVAYTDVDGISQTAYVPLTDFFGGKWTRGMRHIYILSLGGSSKIYFAPGVEAWEEPTDDAVITLDNYITSAISEP